MVEIQHDGAIPLNQQLCELIREQIENGTYQVGEQIPSESKLGEQYGLSRVTVRSAVDHLVEDNILVRIQGKGTFVAAPTQVQMQREWGLVGGSFTRSCVNRGVRPGTRVVGEEWIPAERGLAEWLGLPEGSWVKRIRRVRSIDDRPAVYEVDYLPEKLAHLIEGESLEENSLLWLIREKTGRKADSFESMPGVEYADQECARCLECRAGTPILWVGQVVYSGEDIVYYNEQFIRRDRYSYSIRSVAT